MNQRTNLPDNAFQFRAEPATMAGKTEAGSPRKFGGTAYSAKLIRHPYWGAVIFDMATTQAPDPTPILIGHDRDQRAGFAKLAIGIDGITIADGTLLDNDSGNAVSSESDAGFPWQMSVHIEPDSIEEIKAGGTAMVNGQNVTGPAVVFRNNTIREVSFTPTGVDKNTDAIAFSASAAETPPPTKKDNAMNLEELIAKVASLEAGLKASQDATSAAEDRATAAETQLASIQQEARASAVKALFSAVGREYTEAAAKPYIDMPDALFASVAADMRAIKPTAPDHLFSAHATEGTSPSNQEKEPELDANKIFAARRIA
jgi:hypothetical protein